MTMALQQYCPKAVSADFWSEIGMLARGVGLHQQLKQGVGIEVYRNLASVVGIEQQQLASFTCIPKATLARRVKAGRFSLDEGDRLYRFAEVSNAAIALFEGDKSAARRWLMNPVRGLGGERPVDMLATTAETEAVLDLIGRLEQGVLV
tara:strand:- start:4033 stop:4479 length:447 start_codon:yes stop_codon:yes gene_type:complete